MQWLFEEFFLLFFLNIFSVIINNGQLFSDRKEERYESEVLSDQYHLIYYFIYIYKN